MWCILSDCFQKCFCVSGTGFWDRMIRWSSSYWLVLMNIHTKPTRVCLQTVFSLNKDHQKMTTANKIWRWSGWTARLHFSIIQSLCEPVISNYHMTMARDFWLHMGSRELCKSDGVPGLHFCRLLPAFTSTHKIRRIQIRLALRSSWLNLYSDFSRSTVSACDNPPFRPGQVPIKVETSLRLSWGRGTTHHTMDVLCYLYKLSDTQILTRREVLP